jgi:NADH-ubiquinone oxidoreductase chain 1
LNWIIMPMITNIYYINYSLLIIIIILTIIGYIFLLIGWSSNSVYSIIGAMRVVAQTLSYEVRFIIIILITIILRERYSVSDYIKWQRYMWYLVLLFPLFLVFFVRVLAELNRSPMDFVEGESELVSGFNIEYFRGGFALIFIAEYGIIIFFRYVMLLLFTNIYVYVYIMCIFINVMVLLIIFIRGLLPRMRYDELIYLCWKIILPLVLNYMVLVIRFKFIFIIVIYEKINRKFKISFIYFQNIFLYKIINLIKGKIFSDIMNSWK